MGYTGCEASSGSAVRRFSVQQPLRVITPGNVGAIKNAGQSGGAKDKGAVTDNKCIKVAAVESSFSAPT